MILRRMADAIRAQNWFTVFIEFTLVVVGVLVALQFDNWNAERKDRQSEANLMQRLYADVQAAQERLNGFAETRQLRLRHLKSSGRLLFNNDDTRPLTDEECGAIQESHIITFPPANVSTLEEVLSGGQIGLIKSTAVRQAILDFERVDDRARTLYLSLNVDRIELARLFPDLISLNYRPDTDNNGEGYELASSCNYKSMLENQAFLNDFASISGRNEAFVRILIGELVEALQQLHDTLQVTLPTHSTKEDTP